MEKQWLLKSGWVICHCGKGLTLSPSHRRLFFVFCFEDFTKLHDFLLVSHVWLVSGWMSSVLYKEMMGDQRAEMVVGQSGKQGDKYSADSCTDQLQLWADVTLCCHTSGWLTQISVFTQECGWSVPNRAEKENRQHGWEADTLLLSSYSWAGALHCSFQHRALGVSRVKLTEC